MPNNKPKTNLDSEHTELKKNYSFTFTSSTGEEVLKDLVSAYYHRGSFSKDPYETAYKEGQRSVIIRILNYMEDKNG